MDWNPHTVVNRIRGWFADDRGGIEASTIVIGIALGIAAIVLLYGVVSDEAQRIITDTFSEF